MRNALKHKSDKKPGVSSISSMAQILLAWHAAALSCVRTLTAAQQKMFANARLL